MQRDQTVLEMAEKVLERQARALVARIGQTFEAAMEAVADTDAGRQLKELANGEHREQRASEWQASILRKRIEERHYSWIESYMECGRKARRPAPNTTRSRRRNSLA